MTPSLPAGRNPESLAFTLLMRGWISAGLNSDTNEFYLLPCILGHDSELRHNTFISYSYTFSIIAKFTHFIIRLFMPASTCNPKTLELSDSSSNSNPSTLIITITKCQITGSMAAKPVAVIQNKVFNKWLNLLGPIMSKQYEKICRMKFKTCSYC